MDAVGTSRGRNKISRACKTLLLCLVLLLGLSLPVAGCYFVLPWLDNGGSAGSATGQSAIDRAAQFLGNVGGGRWRTTATNARAMWGAPDGHGDTSYYFAFDLPPQEVAAFEKPISEVWSTDPNFRGPDDVKSMPGANDDPDWIHEDLEKGIYYQRGIETIGISRTTGRVLFRRWEN